MSDTAKKIRRFNQQYQSLSFSEVMRKSDDEYLDLLVEMDAQGNVLLESKFAADGELDERNEYVYSAGGKLLEHTLYYAFDDVTEKKVYRRDDKERLLEEVKLYGEDEGEKLVYAHDEKDRITSITRYDEEGELDYREEIRYDEFGELLSRKKFDSEGKLRESLEVQKGEEMSVQEQSFGIDGAVESTTVTRFDKQGRELQSVQHNAQGKKISSVACAYDERGNVLERSYQDFYSKTIRYAYDDQDRMVMQELFDGTGLLLRKNLYEYDEQGRLLTEQVFEIDASRGGRDKHYGHRYEYEG